MPTTHSSIVVVPPTIRGYPEPVPVNVAIRDAYGNTVSAYTTRNGSTLHDAMESLITETTTFFYPGSPGPLTVRCTTAAGQVVADLTIRKVRNSMVECRPPAFYPGGD